MLIKMVNAKLKMKLGHTIRLHITKWVKEFS